MPTDWMPPKSSLLIPYLTVADVGKALAWYADVCGFEPELCAMRDGTPVHASMAHHGRTVLMLGAPGEMRPPSASGDKPCWGPYVYCEDVDAVAGRARAAGAPILQEPAEQFWGDRVATLTDPDGYNWTFATKVREFDPSRPPDGFTFEVHGPRKTGAD